MPSITKPSGLEMNKYVIDNIDRAIAEGWIIVYYQPVVRILTGEICGLEALARWMDPKYGLLAPYEFVEPLEKARLIHKLDICIIELICSDYAASMHRHDLMPTISFNLSRLDFAECDIHEAIENAIRTNRIPREALRVEITESTMGADDSTMHEAIDRFWERGLRVWMDDFGSGYSSLNVLKDYRFETLKIDMIFLRNFNERSMEILKSIVDMSKRIGVHTLAEGVETKEHLDFLRSIGCEKAQGYYIGKPMPYEACMRHINEMGFGIESLSKRQYHHDIGRINVLSARPMMTTPDNETAKSSKDDQVPLAIVELSGGRIHYLFANEGYLETLKALGINDTGEIETEFSEGDSKLRGAFMEMMRKADATGDVTSADFVRGSCYCYAQVRFVASYPGGKAYLCILHNLSGDSMLTQRMRLENRLESICRIYDWIVEVDLVTDKSESLYHSAQTRRDYNRSSASKEIAIFAKEEIFAEDRDRYLALVDLTTVEDRLMQSGTGWLSELVRIKEDGHHFSWCVFEVMFAGRPSERRVLVCQRHIDKSVSDRFWDYSSSAAFSSTPSDNEFSSDLLWKNFTHFFGIGLFWKNKNRQFAGVNNTFLDYYGMKDANSLLGRTDDEVGWHVDRDPFKIDEENVIKNGERTYLVPGTCIRKGEIRNIVASKFPIYDNGDIVGLMGYFLDVTDWEKDASEPSIVSKRDSVTGTMGLVGLVEATLRYQDSYVFTGEDFAAIFFDIDRFHRYVRNYGRDFGNLLLQTVAKKIQDIVGVEGVLGRISGDHFLVIRQFANKEDVHRFTAEVVKSVESTFVVDDIPCTIYLFSGYAFYSETKSLQHMISDAESRLEKE